MEINCREGKVRADLQIGVPEGRLKRPAKVRVPLAGGCRVVEMIDDAFVPHTRRWRAAGRHHVLDAGSLAPGRYRVTVEADADAAALGRLVYARQALNRDSDGEGDDYWLESSIAEPRLLKRICAGLEVRDVDVGVAVGMGVVVDIEKMFGLAMPPEARDTLECARRILDASSAGLDRSRLLRAALRYKRQAARYPDLDPGDLQRIVGRATGREATARHIVLDRPYRLDGFDYFEGYAGAVPQGLGVQVSARLTLGSPIAEGRLRFMRKGYMDRLRGEFRRLKKEKAGRKRRA